jgi:hypothetical protein
MPSIDPIYFLDDPQIKAFVKTRRVDLTATDEVEILSQGKFVVYKSRVPAGQVEIVKHVCPFVEKRTDIGTPDESFERIPASQADGFFSFNPLVNNNPPLIIEINMNRPTVAASPSNKQRAVQGGITFMSDSPWIDAQRFNPNFAFPVSAGQELIITFELLPPALTGGIPNPFQIGTGNKRVDFAGIVVHGVVMPQPVFDRLHSAQENIYDAEALSAKQKLGLG